VLCYAANVPGFCRCYRCGILLFNPDDIPAGVTVNILIPDGKYYLVQKEFKLTPVAPLTVDRIVPGVLGGTYRRNNIRPACGTCNSETGGALASRGRKTA